MTLEITKTGKVTRMASGTKEYGKVTVILPELSKMAGKEIRYTFITDDC